MMSSVLSHSPILVVLLPLLAGPLCMLFGNRTIAYFVSILASLCSFLLSVYLLSLVSDGTVLSYHLGGWAPPLGIEYRVDAANALVLVIVSVISILTLPYARKSIEGEIAEKHHTLFYACFMMCFTGLMGVTITGDAFNVFVFLEVSSLSTYVLVALGAEKDRRALSAAYDYLILGTIGATFFVIGLGLIYMATGTLNMVDLAERITSLENNRTVRSGFAFIVVGMGVKVAIFPLHRWLPGAYTYAPSAISAFLAATATKVAIYVVMRFIFLVFSTKFGFEKDTLTFIFFPLAIVAMFAASFTAVYQVNLKRLLAFSSVAQIGYMLLGISLFTVTGLSAAMVHLFNHALTKGALFFRHWRHHLSHRVSNVAEHGRTGPKNALDKCSDRDWWPESHWRAGNRRVCVEVGIAESRPGTELLACFPRHRAFFTDLDCLCLENYRTTLSAAG